MSGNFYTDAELEEIFYGEGLRAHVENQWIDVDRIEDPVLADDVQSAYDYLLSFETAIDRANENFDQYLSDKEA